MAAALSTLLDLHVKMMPLTVGFIPVPVFPSPGLHISLNYLMNFNAKAIPNSSRPIWTLWTHMGPYGPGPIWVHGPGLGGRRGGGGVGGWVGSALQGPGPGPMDPYGPGPIWTHMGP